MPKLPRISGRQARRAFERDGWLHGRTTGDHMQWTKPGYRTLVIPDKRELDPRILRGLLRAARLDIDRFIELLYE
jgi:predicted RNA binding protein YcfA (HicA-like mRNA interferase family)